MKYVEEIIPNVFNKGLVRQITNYDKKNSNPDKQKNN
jgi:hypothetical protein